MSTLISILSTDHGRLRREQRDIRKRDLCKALKYGKRERCWGQRWKIEYDGIIFIVNNSLTQEVTAYPSPLALAPIDTKDHILQNRTRDLFKLKPELVTTHTVLVVDTSGSMTKHDINLHRDRQTAAYSVTAMEFVAEQLFMQTATNSDIVSVIEFNSEATEVISKEPCSWVLYNKLLSRRDGRTFKARENEHFRDTYHGDSNYIPALEAADKILGSIDHDCCALSMLFLSDGSPTDATALGLTPLAAKRLMAKKVTEISVKYQEKLNIQMVGFGAPCQDFSVLEQLAEAALSTKSGTKANFTYCGKVADEIGSAVSNLVSSTTATKIQLLKHDRGKTRTKRKMELESRTKGEKICFNYFKICGHYVYNPMKNDFQVFDDLPPGAVIGGELDVEYRHDSSKSKMPPPLLAISKNPCGQGAERLAFRCHLSRKSSEEGFVFNAMVAKETILVERPDDNIQFHKEFCKAQNLSGYLAIEFNHRLKALPWYSETFTPTIVFLPCSVLTLDDPEWHGRGVLVEKRLNTEKYPWRKYNDNAGGIDGKYYHAPVDVEVEFAKLDEVPGDIMEEGSEEESDDEIGEDSDEEDSLIADDKNNDDDDGVDEQVNHEVTTTNEEQVNHTDYIQAFTHFTYLFTNKEAMVCDLQGVYNADMVPPTFELTDPAIHYRSKSGKSNVFGRTDAGERGMDLFFKTHKCNRVCKLMKLSRKNKRWKRQWRSRQHY